jgi:Domain of unknown function (DUF4411)
MKRRADRTLFDGPDSEVYLIDSSAWFNIDLRDDCGQVWQRIYQLIAEKRIVICAEVFDEIRNSTVYERIKLHEAALKEGDLASTDLEYLQLIGKITHEHPSMSRARSRKFAADPYVVALAKLQGYTVVADESRARVNRKIPGACRKLDVCCLTLEEFVEKIRR